MKAFTNKAHEQQKIDDISDQQLQIDNAKAYNTQGKYINKSYSIELKKDLETFRKVWYIAACMDTEDSTVYEVFYNSNIDYDEKTKVVSSALNLYTKKRKEIIKLAAGDVEGLTDQQEVALCGAIFRVAIAVPAVLALNGQGLE